MKEPDGREGNLIGEGGVCQPENCWPQLNYNLDKNYWNKVYATEFVTAFMRFWWSLPRETARFQVQPSSLYTLSTSDGIEMVCAQTKPDNKASQRVLEKSGFVLFEDMDIDGLRQWRNVSSNK